MPNSVYYSRPNSMGGYYAKRSINSYHLVSCKTSSKCKAGFLVESVFRAICKSSFFRWDKTTLTSNTPDSATSNRDFFFPLVDYSKILDDKSPLIDTQWSKLLTFHPYNEFCHMLIDIIVYSTRIGFNCPDQKMLSANLTTITNSTYIYKDDLARQLEKNWFTKLAIIPDQYIFTPLDAKPKSSRK